MKKSYLTLITIIAAVIFVQAQLRWEPTQGPIGIFATRIASSDNYAWLASPFGAYRSADGSQWEHVNLPSIEIIGASGTNVAAVQSSFYSAVAQPKKLFVSHNQGNSWTSQVCPATMPQILVLEIYTHGIYFLEGETYPERMWVTRNEGVTWDTIGLPVKRGSAISFANASDDLIFDGYLLNPTDNSWQLIPNLPPYSQLWKRGTKLIYHTHGVDSVFNSMDNGLTWNRNYIYRPWLRFAQGGNRIYMDGSSLIRYSDNFGQTWDHLPLWNPGGLGFSDLCISNNKLLLVDQRKGVYRFDETAERYVFASEGLGLASVGEIAMAADTSIIALCERGLYKYDIKDQIWTSITPQPDSAIGFEHTYAPFAISDAGVMATVRYGQLESWLSFDHGITWNPVTFPAAAFQNTTVILNWKGEDLYPYPVFNNNANYTSDYGLTWKYDPNFTFAHGSIRFKDKSYQVINNRILANVSGTTDWVDVAVIDSVAFILSMIGSGDRLFVVGGITDGISVKMSTFTSTNGTDWQYCSDGLPFMETWTTERVYLRNAFQANGRYYLRTYVLNPFGETSTLFCSTDSCKTWFPIDQSIPSRGLVLLDTVLYAGSPYGVLKASMPAYYSTICGGQVFTDFNKNGIRDAGELLQGTAQIAIKEAGTAFKLQLVASSQNGDYRFNHTPTRTDTVQLLFSHPLLDAIIPSYYLVNQPDTNLNFAIRYTVDTTDLSAVAAIVAPPRPGFGTSLVLTAKNVGTLPANGTFGLKLDKNLIFKNADPIPSAFIGSDSLVWDLPLLGVPEAFNIKVGVEVSTQAQIGDTLSCSGSIGTGKPELSLADNSFTLHEVVVGSYDPNDKAVFPTKGLTDKQILQGKDLEYKIRFQNTGTFYAERVRITDILDTTLDLSTIRFIQASHKITSFRLLPQGILEILFDQIFLPDSTTDLVGSQGFVKFSVRRKKQYTAGSVVQNRALIYFDFNDPIITNTVISEILPPDTTGAPGSPMLAESIRVFPNPASHVLYLEFDDIKIGHIYNVAFFHTDGRVAYATQLTADRYLLAFDASGLTPMMYSIKITDISTSETFVGKVVIMR